MLTGVVVREGGPSLGWLWVPTGSRARGEGVPQVSPPAWRCLFPHLSTGPRPGSCRRDRTKFTKEQLKTLISTFNQVPRPSYATRHKLALELNTEESRIQVGHGSHLSLLFFICVVLGMEPRGAYPLSYLPSSF